MWEKSYENMTDEELKEHAKRIEKIQKVRKDKTKLIALEDFKTFIEDYYHKGIEFYIPDGCGGGYDINSKNVYVKTWW